MKLSIADAAILFFSTERPISGYDAKKSFDLEFGAQKTIAFGVVYKTLSRLAELGLVSELPGEKGGGPTRTPYRSSTLGRATLLEWLNESTVYRSNLSDLCIQLTIGDRFGLLHDWRRGRLERALEYHSQRLEALNGKGLTDLLNGYLIASIKSDLAWIRHTLQLSEEDAG